MADLPQGYTLDTQTQQPGVPNGYILDSMPQTPVVDTSGQKNFESYIDAGAAALNLPAGIDSAIKGAIQGVRELGHGAFEHLIPLADNPNQSGIGKYGSVNEVYANEEKSMQAQEAAYNALHPDSVVPGVTDKTQAFAKGATKILPYFLGGPEGKVLDTAGINVAAGATQPMQPGENPLAGPLASGITGTLGFGASKIINFGLNKAANSSALRTMLTNLGADKATIDDKGMFGAIQDLASKADTFQPGTPDYIRGQQAKQFVSMIQQKLQAAQQANAPEWQLAMRSDAGAKMLGNKLISDTLFQSRDQIAQEIGKQYGPIDTSSLNMDLSKLVNIPSNAIKLGGVSRTLNQANSVLRQGMNATPPNVSSYVMQQNPALAEALNAITSKQVDYSTLASIRTAIDSKAAELAQRGDTAAPVYAQASQKIDAFMDNYAKDKGDLGKMLQTTDQQARSFYRNNVVPYNEKNLTADLVDPLKNSESIAKPFGNFEEDSPEQATRLKNLLTPQGQDAVRKGMIQTALSAATDDNGYIDAAVFKKGLDMTPNTRNVFFSNPQDKATIDGINNLIAINARTFGKSNNYYQKYMQAYGLENTMAGEFVKGAKQMTAPMFYNLLNKVVFESPTIKRFVQASGRLSEDSPQGLAAANQFSKMVNQAIAAQIANSQPAIQTTNQLLGQQ